MIPLYTFPYLLQRPGDLLQWSIIVLLTHEVHSEASLMYHRCGG